MKKEYRNVTRTKKSIKTAFIELLGEKKTIERITVGELAARADVAKSTFYNHYSDVYAVAEEFENELLGNLTRVFEEIGQDGAADYSLYIHKIAAVLKDNEELYRKVISSPDVRFFLEKLKSILSKRMYANTETSCLSKDARERYVQIRFLTTACVDTLADYFRGILDVTLDEMIGIVIFLVAQFKK